MTMRTYTHYVCPNGHRGFVKITENDQPYSEMWERITTDGLGEVIGSDGKPHYVCAVCTRPVVATDMPKS